MYIKTLWHNEKWREIKEAVRMGVFLSEGLRNPAQRCLRQDQWNRARLTQEHECSPTRAHNHFPFSNTNAPLSPGFHALMPSSPHGCCDVGRGKEEREKTQMGKEGQQTGEMIRNIKHGLERHQWCKDDIPRGVTHAVNCKDVLLSCTKDYMQPL